MCMMTTRQFKDFLFDYFIEWEKQQPKRRSTYTAFAKWLSDNSLNVTIKQQLLSDWIKGRYKPNEEKYLLVLEEKIGKQIYNVLDVPRPNPYLQKINQLFERLSPEHQQQLAEQAERYETKNVNPKTTSPKRKTTPPKTKYHPPPTNPPAPPLLRQRDPHQKTARPNPPRHHHLLFTVPSC